MEMVQLGKRLREYFQKLTFQRFKRDSATSIPILIPARGGSKRIPGKNLARLNGQPLIHWAIKACKEVTKDVIVSSDSPRILQYAEEQGAQTLLRPPSLSLDDTTSEQVIQHFLTTNPTEIVVLVQATSPFVRPMDILEAISLYRTDKYDSVTSVSSFRGKLRYYNRDNRKFELVDFKEKTSNETNNLLLYRETGAVYVTSRKAIKNGERCIHGNVGLVEIPLRYSVDIDEYEDLALAEVLMRGGADK